MIREMMKEEEEEEKEVATKQKPNITEDADKKMGERVWDDRWDAVECH